MIVLKKLVGEYIMPLGYKAELGWSYHLNYKDVHGVQVSFMHGQYNSKLEAEAAAEVKKSELRHYMPAIPSY